MNQETNKPSTETPPQFGAVDRFRHLRPLKFAPLIFALPLIWLFSENEVRIEPSVWVSIAAVVLIALRTAFPLKRLGWLDFVLAGLMGVAATHVLFYPGFPQGHDITTHLWGTYGFYQAILAGNPLPRWIHHLGLGMPFLMFYPPIAFYLMLPFLALDLAIYDAFKYGFILFNVLSGLAMYFVVYRWTSSRRAALVAATAYCFAPYHLLESQYRVAVAEAAAMAILPLFFYYVHNAVKAPSQKSWRKAAVWIALLTLTHPLSLSMAGIAMGIWLLVVHRLRPDKALIRSLGLLALVSIIGLSLAGYYTVPVAAESKYTAVTDAMGGKNPLYAHYGLMPNQLIERREWSKSQRAEGHRSKSKDNEMPFYFGISLLVLIPLATSSERKETVLGLKAITLGTLLLTLYPLDIAFARFPPMTMLQFPWRFMAIATCGASALAGFATLYLLESPRTRQLAQFIPGVLVALLVFDFYPYQGAASWSRAYEGIHKLSKKGEVPDPLPLRMDRLSYPPSHADIDLSLVRRVYREYFSRDTLKFFKNAQKTGALERASVGMTFHKRRAPKILKPAPYAEFSPKGSSGTEGLEFTRAGGKITVELPGKKGTLEIKEQWFPGWDVSIDSNPVQLGKTKDGLMKIDLEADDDGTLTLIFSRTRWDRLAGILLSLGTLAGLFLPWNRKSRKGIT